MDRTVGGRRRRHTLASGRRSEGQTLRLRQLIFGSSDQPLRTLLQRSSQPMGHVDHRSTIRTFDRGQVRRRTRCVTSSACF